MADDLLQRVDEMFAIQDRIERVRAIGRSWHHPDWRHHTATLVMALDRRLKLAYAAAARQSFTERTEP
jgi:hypothetical protein